MNGSNRIILEDPLRGTGRSTAKVLHAIAFAIECRGQWVPFVDHYPMKGTAEDFADALKMTAERLGLLIQVKRNRNEVLLRSSMKFVLSTKLMESELSKQG